MRHANRFPKKLLLNEPDRRQRLIREFYQDCADTAKTPNFYTETSPQHERLDQLLRFYFGVVEYLPLSGTAQRHPRWRLSYICLFAISPGRQLHRNRNRAVGIYGKSFERLA
jgi:hypothetical protein